MKYPWLCLLLVVVGIFSYYTGEYWTLKMISVAVRTVPYLETRVSAFLTIGGLGAILLGFLFAGIECEKHLKYLHKQHELSQEGNENG